MPVLKPVTHSDPQVSVVVPTLPENNYEPPDTLRNQTFDAYEVIAVSDAELNRCEARNEGMEIATADIVAQTDDDCTPPETWIENIHRQFSEDRNLVLVEGPLDKHRSSPRNYVGANMAYRRDYALDIGGFDSEFDGWRADTDFGWRMEIEYGVDRCRYDANLEVVHQGPLRTNVNRELERKFRARYPDRYFTLLDHPTSVIGDQTGKVVAIVYSLFPKPTERLIQAFE